MTRNASADDVGIDLGEPLTRREEAVFKLSIDALTSMLDLVDIYDRRLVALGEPQDRVYSPEHVASKERLRGLIALFQNATESKVTH